MKYAKLASFSVAAAVTISAIGISAFAETITMADAGHGVNGGKSLFPDGITAYESTLGDLAEICNTMDFTISVADLGGRDDMSFQVYVSADNWAIWANGLTGDTPAISEAGKEYTFSLNVDEIAETYGADKVICDMGFQVLSATPGDVDVTYDVVYNNDSTVTESTETEPNEETIAAENNSTGDTSKPTEDKGNADTGVEGVAVSAVAAIIAGSAVIILKKRK